MNMTFGGMPSQRSSSPEAEGTRDLHSAARGKERRVVLETSRPRAAREQVCVDGRAARRDSSRGAKKSIANSRLKKEAEHLRGPEETHCYPQPENKEIGEKRRICAPKKRPENDAKKGKEEVVENVTEKCTNNTSRSDQHRRSRILRGCGSAKAS